MSLGFSGNVYKPGTAGYEEANNIYATSTYGVEHDMNPGLIYQPLNISDIQEVVRIANGSKPFTPLAIRTGGHQYSGASSTSPTGIQLDLQYTFRDAEN